MFPLLRLNKSIPDEKLLTMFSFGIIRLSFTLLFFVFPEIFDNWYCNFKIQFSAIAKTIITKVLLLLTHFQPMFHFFTSWKHQKTSGFLTFSGGFEIQHWLEMGLRVQGCAFSSQVTNISLKANRKSTVLTWMIKFQLLEKQSVFFKAFA